MKVLSILTPKRPLTPSDMKRLSLPEELRVWSLYASQRIREFYFQPDPMKVMLVWEEASVGSVSGFLGSFPMVKEDFFDIELIHLGPWLPFQVLFRPEALAAQDMQ